MPRLLDVNAPVLKRDDSEYCEAKLDALGRYCLEPGEDGKEKKPKLPHAFTPDDVPVIEPRKLGSVINFGLDQTAQDMKADEGRARFALSVRVQKAMNVGELLRIDRKDEDRIAAAADLLVKVNHMFVARIHEALEAAEPERATEGAARATANG